MGTDATARLREAREELSRLRTSYDGARASFWEPDVGETLNLVHDWFDPIATGTDRRVLSAGHDRPAGKFRDDDFDLRGGK